MATTPQLVGQRQEMAVSDNLQRFGMLPDWLSAIADSDRVRRALVRGIPEFASGALVLQDCDVGRVRMKKDSWTALCQLTVEKPPQGQQEVVKIRGTLIPPGLAEPDQTPGTVAFGTTGWRCYLPEIRLRLEMQPPDAALPALAPLTDPQEARDLLERGIRAGAPAYGDLRIQACTPKIMRYKPGSRCTVLYRLEYPTEAADRDWPEIVVAKTYHGDKGRIAYDGMRALWDSSLAGSSAVTLAEPLAFLPEMNVLVQGPIREEQTLQDLLRSALQAGTPQALEELNQYMRKTAVGLAELHRSQVDIGEPRTWEDELAEVYEVVERLATSIPALADAATPLLERLKALAAANPADPPVPTHGTFRPAQVLLNKGQIGFIDFDGFCRAEPALDLALFLGKIEDIGLEASRDDEDEDAEALDQDTLRTRLAQTKAIGDAFLAEYSRHLPVSQLRIALWKALDVLTVVLHCWTKVKPQRLSSAMLMLEQHLRDMELS